MIVVTGMRSPDARQSAHLFRIDRDPLERHLGSSCPTCQSVGPPGRCGSRRNHRPISCIVEMMSESPPTSEGRPALDLAGLYDREAVPMLHLACLLVGSRSIAEEIVQDAFVVVGERWSALDKPGGYLRSTVVNGCRMALRRRATEQRYARVDAEAIDAPTELIELQCALDRLSERARAVVVLRYFVGLADSEIAELLGCRVPTVRSIVHRSLHKLRKELS
jgi:RNA polymerase sigma factor (sigma-70 family)